MAAVSSGRASRPNKIVKSGTTSMRKHRFQSFNQRIAKLNIDPIHKTRRIDTEIKDDDPTASYFKTDLDRWKDLNLSENFSNFSREVSPLCDSLPQVLHYHANITSSLTSYIRKGDSHSLEPLLSLLASFAHDLASKFESHFSEAVSLVTSLAAKHSDVEVIEWSFNCLAWLFKYLSRLLVPDLRPLLRLMTPFLGKEPQKFFTTRFAAESMSFLVRKAALVYHKSQKPLKNAITFILDEVDQVEIHGCSAPLYYHGLKTLLVDAIKGIDRGVHSSGPALYGCLVEGVLSESVVMKGRMEILEGVTVGLIHHTEASTFQSILEVAIRAIEEAANQKAMERFSDAALDICERLLCVLSTVRKGSRIQKWSPMLDALLNLLRAREEQDTEPTSALLEAAVVIMQSAPLDELISRIRPIVDRIADRGNQGQFLGFCRLFRELNKERFDSLIHPYFLKFLRLYWQSQSEQICSVLPDMVGENPEAKITFPTASEENIINQFHTAEVSGEQLAIANCYNCLAALPRINVSMTTLNAIMQVLQSMMRSSLESPAQVNHKTMFSLGAGLKACAELESNTVDSTAPKLWRSLTPAAEYYKTLPLFLEGVWVSLKNEKMVSEALLNDLVHHMIENLHSSSHTLRRLSLQIIATAYTKANGGEEDILATALMIETMPLDLKSARTIAMYIRKLASQFKDDHLHPWIQKAIPHFCFGVQTFKLSPLWDDAIEVLKQICENPSGEEIVADLAFRWLETPVPKKGSADLAVESSLPRSLAEYECSNLINVDAAHARLRTELEHPKEQSTKRFQDIHVLSQGSVMNPSTIALRILLGIPKIAEKRSRRLVPLFLDWTATEDDEKSSNEQTPPNSEEDGVSDNQKLSGPDRKSLLRLFALFNNPKVLYRSEEVFNTLRKLLANGDVETQKFALNAIFAWKLDAVRPYQEHLLNILDDSRFRDEISTFLHTDEQTSSIQHEHRSQLMPILLRLLYGKLTTRTGNQTAKRTQALKRKVIFEALSQFEDGEIQQFLDVALGSTVPSQILDPNGQIKATWSQAILSPRKQIGLLNMIKDLLTTLGSRLAPFTPTLVKAVIYCTVWASGRNSREHTGADNPDVLNTSLVKNIRQLGLQCLNLLFQHCAASDIQNYLPVIFEKCINPRLDLLPIETAQSVSALLQLFSTWASSSRLAFFLVQCKASLIGTISSCLEIQFAKEEVKAFVLDNILKKLLLLVESEQSTENKEQQLQTLDLVLRPNVDIFLVHVGTMLRGSPTRDLLASAIEFVTRLAPFVQGSAQTKNILEIASFLLTQPSQRVSPKVKGDLLEILRHFVPHYGFHETKGLQDTIFATISSLFGYFKDRSNRVALVEVLTTLAEKDQELQRAAALCRSLNSYSANKVDEPDFDVRLQAFSAINEEQFNALTEKEWRPILYNMLYYIKDAEELAIRSNASFALRRFIEANPFSRSDVSSQKSGLLVSVLLPAIRKGASDTSELVRAEYLAVMAHLVRLNPEWDEVNDMSVLLVGDDEEASFFSNVLHIQQHRRLRALRRLSAEARQDHLQANNVAHFFLPLIEHFIFDQAEDESAHNLTSEAIIAVGALALSLDWPQYRAVFRRYVGYIESKPTLEKSLIKLVGVMTDSLSSVSEREAECLPHVQGEGRDVVEASSPQKRGRLGRTMPRHEKLADDLKKHLLPALGKYLHQKDESTVSLRVPVAVSAVKLLKLLSPDQVADALPPILTDVCNILRSRAQESRDLTRKTLMDIADVVGPSYFGFIIKELRRALARGYQLHVLSYTVHSLLVGTASNFKLGDLDYCLPQIVAIILDDTFGATGQEKDAEEYISKMKEVKSSKSYDSMEIVARTATAEHFLHLVRPIQSLLEERLDLKMTRKVDELLRRVGVGLLHNPTIQNRQVLIFCHEIIRETYSSNEQHRDQLSAQSQRNKRFLVNVKGSHKTQRGSTSSYKYKLVRFAFDLLRSILHRYNDLQTPANLAGFMPMIGDAMVQSNEEVQMAAIRLLTTIIRVPLQEIDNNAVIYVSEAVKIIKASPTTNTELAQAALKLVSAILRERRDVEVRDIDVAYLLKRIQPDLEELDRQGVAFTLLKAVMARKIVIVEVYDVLETIASMMITNQTKGARDQARSVYFDFLTHYPQGKGRFAKQSTFLVKNLDYKHHEGRQSVMEVIHLLLSKLNGDLQQAALGTFFVPLLMVVVNDESLPCREMAGALLNTCFEKAGSERLGSFSSLLRAWLSKSDQPLLLRVAIQIFGIYCETHGAKAEKDLPILFSHLTRTLKANLIDSTTADWELVYYALQTFLKVCQMFPAPSFALNTASLWTCIRQSLSFPHVWVKLSAARLMGMFFADLARTNADVIKPELSLQGSNGLRLGGLEMEHITKASLALLKVPAISEELATQSVRNLVFLAKLMNSTSLEWDVGTASGGTIVDDPLGESEDELSNPKVKDGTQGGLAFIFQRASSILRRGPLTTRENSLIPVKAAMQLIWALCNNFPTEVIKHYIETILLPLQNLTDPSIPPPFSSDEAFVNGYKTLLSHASEIMDMLQKKLGTTEYVMYLSKVREGIKGRRENRRVKRRIEAVADPEKTGRFKQRKGEKKKEKRKEKSAGQRSKRRGCAQEYITGRFAARQHIIKAFKGQDPYLMGANKCLDHFATTGRGVMMFAGRGRGKIRPPRRAILSGGELDFEREWKSLSISLRNIHTKNASSLSFEELYRNAYKLVLKKKGEPLYNRVKEFEQDWLANEVRPQILHDLPPSLLAAYDGAHLTVNEKRVAGEKLLRSLKSAWEDHNLTMNMTTDVLMYMDRVYCSDNRKPSIFTASMGQFRDHVLRALLPDHGSLTLAALLYKVILDQIQMDRDGDIINTALLRSCAYMLEGLYETEDEQEQNKLYITSFEPAFLAASAEYYRSEGSSIVARGDASGFCKQALQAATNEQDRCRSTLSTLTAPKIRAVVENELVKKNLPEMISQEGTGVKHMLDNDRLPDLEMVYELSSWVDPKKEELKKAVQKRIVEQGEDINSTAKNASEAPLDKPVKVDADKGDETTKTAPEKPINQQTAAAIKWVDDVLQLKDKYDQVLENAFKSDQGLQTGFTRSFSDFINGFERSSEYLSLFFDENMKKGIKGKTETEVDMLLDKGITLLRYISDKDMFERYYKKHLSRRLLMKRSISMDAERQMISKMKMEVGNTFTQRIEAMFRDMSISEDLTASYKKRMRDLDGADSQKAEIDVNILTATMWPLDAMLNRDGEKKPTCIFPPEIDRIRQSFEKFYLDKHSGRQLTWQGQMGTADLRAYFSGMKGKKTRDLNVSTYCMVILLLFNDLPPGNHLSYEEIQARTNIPDNELMRNLQSLAVAPKTRILVKEPMSKDVKKDDKFYFNEKFTSQFQRIKVGVVASGNKVENVDERKETEERVGDERGHAIEAAIVRTMKQRKELKHQQLITEVIQQLTARFSPDVNLLKKKIESLIEREYLERMGDIDQPAYRYLA
ncbi:MAG: hypothetical protein Q9226_000352 [Calogaya cf. arnoldii]